MSRHTLARACAILSVVLLCGSAHGQQYYGVPIEDGGVAFLLDASASMAGRTEVRGPAAGVKDDEAWRSGIGQTTGRRTVGGTAAPQTSKMELARRELLQALNSLRDGTNFTIITFGNQAAEWPGGVRAMGSASTALAREYVSRLSANGGTPMAEALRLGFQAPNVRTLFVVSDGRPTTAEVLGLVRQLQRSREGRRMVINTVGIGRDQDSALLCRLALDNEGIYVRDREIACTFSPCSPDDGLVTFYPPESVQKARVTRVCSSADHPDCTTKLVYETMLSEAQFQIATRDRTKVANCLQLEDPDPATIVIHADGLEATNYTRPGHPSHPGKIMRIVKQQGNAVVVETTGAGGLRPSDLDAVDLRLIEAVHKKLAPKTPEVDDLPKKDDTKQKIDELPKKKDPIRTKEKPRPPKRPPEDTSPAFVSIEFVSPSSDLCPGEVIRAIRRMDTLCVGTRQQRTRLIEECRQIVGANSMAFCRVPRKGELVLVHLAGPSPDANAVEEIIAYGSKRSPQSFSLLRRRESGDLALAGRGSDVVSAVFPKDAEPWTEHVVAFVAERLLRSSKASPETGGPPARTAAGIVLPPEMVVGTSAIMRDLLQQMNATIGSRLDVLLSGETGTGKELLARVVHESGPTRGGPFVAINCAAIPADLLEAELFGVERRVATGVDPRAGLFLEADRGSIFLDEIAELPERLQPKLLRVIQEREVLAVGATRPRKISFRIISASNQDLANLVSSGPFRADLYYRLRGLEFHTPPLRERIEDIPVLALEFLARTADEYGKNITGISSAALELLAAHPWPGNIRELQTEICRAALVCPDGESLTTEHFAFRSCASAMPAIALDEDVPPTAILLRERVAEIERAEIENAMREAGGNRSLAARLLGITRNGLAHKIRRLGLVVGPRRIDRELRRGAK
jgi:DNA-binding NtrC family response regulator